MTHDPDKEVKYVVKKGDTIWGIARRFKVSQAEIIDRNDIQDPAMIRPGRELYIPKRAGVEVVADPPVVEQEIETESVTTETATEGEAITEGETETTSTEVTTEVTAGSEGTELDESHYLIHEVVAGDTIWKLARTYKVTTDEIIRLNDIEDPRKIQIGQKIKIPKK
jgi:spore germination protein